MSVHLGTSEGTASRPPPIEYPASAEPFPADVKLPDRRPDVRTAQLVAGLPNPFDGIPAQQRLEQVRRVLDGKHLGASFGAHVMQQLRRDGQVTVGVVDDFRPGQTHARNVVARILANAPEGMRIRIVKYDIGGKDRAGVAAVLNLAANDAKNKKLVALSLSGGMSPYSVKAIESWTGRPLDKGSANRAFEVTSQRARLTLQERQAWQSLQQASKVIPTVTPVWNDGNTTLGALSMASADGIVTSIDSGGGSVATELPLIDVRMPAQPFNTHSSQSAPTFIGQALRAVFEQRTSRPEPNPRASGDLNGGLPF